MHQPASALVGELQRFVADLTHREPAELAPDRELYVSGIIDSLNLVELVSFVERRCGFRVAATELTLDNWGSLVAIDAYVTRRTAP